ncbi:hypothetical protein CQW23_21437 [Capsicum baccatum]|uniref:Uncharacterized protein n=1 Tax=Capsicum baccatum TaxID=33114 RepID=A0A2G2VXZ9_CAPBA|nr:hypothetical protein CQW23_21437 [Capsicum baccatum]
MATCTSDVFMPPDTRWPPKVLTVLGGRLCPLKIQDEKIGYSGVEFWIVNIDIQPPLMEVKLEEWLSEEDEVNWRDTKMVKKKTSDKHHSNFKCQIYDLYGIPSIEPVATSDASRVQAFNSKALGTEGVLEENGFLAQEEDLGDIFFMEVALGA